MTALGAPWPASAARRDGVVSVGGVPVTDLADEFGTPLWVVDEADLRNRARGYLAAFPGATVAYAAKAWSVTGILEILGSEGLAVVVASEGELRTAAGAGIPMARVIFHGSNKGVAELEAAADLGVARVVVDSFDELDRMEEIGRRSGHVFDVWLRITPGIDAHTHEYVRTGHDDSKFGFTLSLGLADRALERALELDHVRPLGVQAHIGSQIFGTGAFVANAEVLVELLSRWRAAHGLTLRELDLGGGMGIPYTHEDHPLDPARYGEVTMAAVAAACAARGFPVPALTVEPGRAIVGPSALTLYEVGTVKRLPGLTTWVSVDGGMSDNIRPALYEAEHEIALVSRQGVAEPVPVSVVGKHCESGDIVRRRATLPGDLAVGDLVAVAATGAYTESMASNYNRVPRPAAVLVADGSARLLLRRETFEDLVRRDVRLFPAGDPPG